MSFSVDLWDRFDFLNRENQEQKKAIDEFLQSMQDRVELEDYYSRNLEKLAYNLNKIFRKGTIIEAIQGVKQGLLMRAEQSKEMGNRIKQDIIDEFRFLLKCQASDYKKSRQQYYQISKQQEDCFLYKQSLNSSQELAMSQLQKLQKQNENLINQQHSQELKCKYHIQQYNLFLENYTEQMSKIMAILQKQQTERMKMVQQSIMKILVFETSCVRNQQYDVERISQKLEKVDIEQDVLDYIQQNKTDKKYYKKAMFEPYISFINKSIKTNGHSNGNNQNDLLQCFRKYYCELLNEKEKGLEEYFGTGKESLAVQQAVELGGLMKQGWDGQMLSEQQVTQFCIMMRECQLRQVWSVCLKQFRNNGKFILLEQGYENIKILCYNVLNCCMVEKDVETVNDIMIMSLTFYKVIMQLQDNGQIEEQKVFLQNELQDHPIWKNKDYWKSAIFQQIQLELEQVKNINQKSEANFREKNSVFNVLTSFSFNMFIFKMAIKDIKEIVNQFGVNYHLWDLQIKDLMLHIENFGKDSSKLSMSSIQLSILYKGMDEQQSIHDQQNEKNKQILDQPSTKTKKLVFKNIETEKMKIFE